MDSAYVPSGNLHFAQAFHHPFTLQFLKIYNDIHPFNTLNEVHEFYKNPLASVIKEMNQSSAFARVIGGSIPVIISLK